MFEYLSMTLYPEPLPNQVDEFCSKVHFAIIQIILSYQTVPDLQNVFCFFRILFEYAKMQIVWVFVLQKLKKFYKSSKTICHMLVGGGGFGPHPLQDFLPPKN